MPNSILDSLRRVAQSGKLNTYIYERQFNQIIERERGKRGVASQLE